MHVRIEPRRIIARSRFVHRQTISVLLHQSGQPTHPRLAGRRTSASSSLLRRKAALLVLARSKFAFRPTSFSPRGGAAASVHPLTKIASHERHPVARIRPPETKILRGRKLRRETPSVKTRDAQSRSFELILKNLRAIVTRRC